MSSRLANADRYELTIRGNAWGGRLVFRKWHDRLEDAKTEAGRILATLPDRGRRWAVIFGPGCGRAGVTVR